MWNRRFKIVDCQCNNTLFGCGSAVSTPHTPLSGQQFEIEQQQKNTEAPRGVRVRLSRQNRIDGNAARLSTNLPPSSPLFLNKPTVSSGVSVDSVTGPMEAASSECNVDPEGFRGERRKLIQPTSLNDPKLVKLKQALVDWINETLHPEHIVVQSLEEDLYDGLVLHHLLSRLAGVHVPVEEIALTGAAQMRKLEAVLEELHKRPGLRDGSRLRWSAKLLHDKDLLATLHLLVAVARCLQPQLALPPNVSVEVVSVEVSSNGIKSSVQTEVLTGDDSGGSDSLRGPEREDSIEQLLKLEAHKVTVVKKAILHFVNQNMSAMGLQVADMEKQFADGVILLLLIGQLEGFFIPLCDFSLTPVNQSHMLRNVTLALDLLNDTGLHECSVNPQDIVSQDMTATLKVLYALFQKHKKK